MPSRPATPTRSHEEYLAGLKEDQRAALERLSRIVLEVVPDAQPCFSYGLPAFRQEKVIVGFGATAHHCAFYPMSGSMVAAFQEELEGFETSKGAIRFQPEKPLPESLVRRIIEARLEENRRDAGK